jgi:hypothetical protein
MTDAMTAPYRAPGLASSALASRFLAELVAELEPGERVLWTAVPERVALMRRAMSELLMPLAFNGFVLALVALCSHDGGSLALSAVPLLALGLPLFQTPLAAWQAMRTTFYAVTDRRALVFEADAIVSVDRRAIVCVRVRARRGDAGDVALVVRPATRAAQRGAAFVGLRDAPAVAAMLRAA